MTVCSECGTASEQQTTCARCGASLESDSGGRPADNLAASPADGTPKKWGGTLNAGSLLFIPLALLLDEFSATFYFAGVLTNGAAGVAWIAGGYGPQSHRWWAVVIGVVVSFFLGSFFLVAAVWSGV